MILNLMGPNKRLDKEIVVNMNILIKGCSKREGEREGTRSEYLIISYHNNLPVEAVLKCLENTRAPVVAASSVGMAVAGFVFLIKSWREGTHSDSQADKAQHK